MEAEALRPTFGLLAGDALEPDAASDEQLALRAREQYRESGIPELRADEHIAPHLERDERVLCYRQHATIRRIDVDDETHTVVSDESAVYVTDRRVIYFNGRAESIWLLDIDELSMADDRILVTLHGSRGVTLDVDNPHQFRVLIAAAKAALRLQAEGTARLAPDPGASAL